jgi:hypothetical protein
MFEKNPSKQTLQRQARPKETLDKVNKRDSSWYFINELDGTPHSRSMHHSTTNFKPVYNFNHNLQ